MTFNAEFLKWGAGDLKRVYGVHWLMCTFKMNLLKVSLWDYVSNINIDNIDIFYIWSFALASIQ